MWRFKFPSHQEARVVCNEDIVTKRQSTDIIVRHWLQSIYCRELRVSLIDIIQPLLIMDSFSVEETVFTGRAAPLIARSKWWTGIPWLKYDLPCLSDERVVWLSDSGPQFGRVKWLGWIPDLGDHWMAVVDFDNPVASDTWIGFYSGEKLFEASTNHSGLLPVVCLMEAADFNHPSSSLATNDNMVDMVRVAYVSTACETLFSSAAIALVKIAPDFSKFATSVGKR